MLDLFMQGVEFKIMNIYNLSPGRACKNEGNN